MAADAQTAPRILCVEDDPALGEWMQAVLEKAGYRAVLVRTVAEALNTSDASSFDLALVDLNLPDGPGFRVLEHLAAPERGVACIVVTVSDETGDVNRAVRAGARDYLTKPVEEQRILVTVENALKLIRSQRDLETLRANLPGATRPEDLVGSCEAMEKVREMIRKVASTDAGVLITGENGTGKELVARAIHFSSARAARPLVEVNSAALADNLLESELFGHEKGAFTGAAARRRGQFEQAHTGTLFLDEIGDMALPTQAKILRVLQDRRFKRLGSEKTLAVDVRVICATNQDLPAMVADKKFRQDLLYRINTFTIELPPLRERRGDIPGLSAFFVDKSCRYHGRPDLELAPETLELLDRHAWPGNVRELEHVIDRAVILCEGGAIEPSHLPPAILQAKAPAEAAGRKGNLVETLEEIERSMILKALEEAGGSRVNAAKALGITKRMIHYKMNTLGIRDTD